MTTVLMLSTSRHFRGGENQAMVLAEALLARDHHVRGFLRRGGPFDGGHAFPGDPTLIPHASGIDLRAGVSILHSLRTARKPVLVCNDSHALTIGALVKSVTGVPLIGIRRVFFPFGRHALSRWKYNQCDRLVAISNAVADMCREVVPGDRVITIPSAATIETDESNRDAARAALELESDNLVAASVADFRNGGKRLGLMLATAARLHEAHPEFRLVLFGALPDSIRETLPGWCRALGYRDRPQRWYRAFDFYLCTSSHEGLGTAILDAAVRDIPAVAPSSGGVGDIYGDSAWLVAPDEPEGFTDMCETIIADLERARNRARRYGVRTRDIFSIDAAADMYERLFSALTPNTAIDPRNRLRHCVRS